MHRTEIGIGQALRRARLHRGKSLGEASRETRIRADYLDALEREAWDAVLGEVYVRGFLRTYSAYLGLRPEKVMTVYERSHGPSPPPEHDGGPRPGFSPYGLLRGQLHQRRGRTIALVGALAVLAAAGAFGLLRRSGTLAEPARSPTTLPAAGVAAASGVEVRLVALDEVGVVVTRDGAEEQYRFQEGEGRSFVATKSIRVRVDRAAAVELTVNGHHLGVPAAGAEPYEAEFGPEDFRDIEAGASASEAPPVAAPGSGTDGGSEPSNGSG
ncbi:MAG TPA: helix-turn-helix domain-containing protein [Actinomycetota bacterium]|nr:helix-turn-helix domain-containing protein [Actinomycetota bacterium]